MPDTNNSNLVANLGSVLLVVAFNTILKKLHQDSLWHELLLNTGINNIDNLFTGSEMQMNLVLTKLQNSLRQLRQKNGKPYLNR